jgi:chromosome segregation and condensation protein ScpB
LWRQLPLVEPEALPGAAGGSHHRTRRIYGEVIRASGTVASKGVDLTALEKLVLTAVAYFQPVTRAGVADILCRAISRDVIAALRGADLIATGPRSPQPGAPHTYVTTPAFFAKGRYVRLQQNTGLRQQLGRTLAFADQLVELGAFLQRSTALRTS